MTELIPTMDTEYKFAVRHPIKNHVDTDIYCRIED